MDVDTVEPINARSMIDAAAAATATMTMTAAADQPPLERRRRLSKAALAVAKPAMVTTVDYLKDMAGLTNGEKLKALMLLRANLDADIAQVERDMGKSKAALATVKETKTTVAKARRAAVAK